MGKLEAKLDGKIALITGGGIGLATAKRFVEEGAYVFMIGRRETELNAAVKDIRRSAAASVTPSGPEHRGSPDIFRPGLRCCQPECASENASFKPSRNTLS